jgi:ribose transport system permease protein
VIATLGMLSLARGAALAAGKGNGVSFEGDNPLAWLGYEKWAGLPTGFWLALVLTVALTVLITRTRIGRRMIMLGSDPAAAELVGVRAPRTLLFAYGITGLTAGIAALIYLGRAGVGLPTEGNGLELATIAAAVIGGTALSGGVGRPWLVLVGALFIQSLNNGLNLAGTSPYVQELILGAVIVFAGLSDRLMARLPLAPARRMAINKEGAS